MSLFCMQCDKTIASDDERLRDKAHAFYGGCPECGSRNLPIDFSTRVDVKITWDELRILVMWSEFWATHCIRKDPSMKSMAKAVYSIADRLTEQHMDRQGLTFSSELAELSGKGIKYEQNVIEEDLG